MTKKRGIFHKILRFMFGWALEWWWALQRIKKAFSGTGKNICEAVKTLRHPCRNVIRIDDPAAPDMTNFRDVLRHWEVDEDDIPSIIRMLYGEMAFYSVLPAGLGSWFLWRAFALSAPFDLFTGVCLVGLAATVIATRFWRIRVLKNRRFILFYDWILFRDSLREEDDCANH
jgi:hypothetical protein